MKQENRSMIFTTGYFIILLIFIFLPFFLIKDEGIQQFLSYIGSGMFFGSIFFSFYFSNKDKGRGAFIGLFVLLLILSVSWGDGYLIKRFFSKDLVLFSISGFVMGIIISYISKPLYKSSDKVGKNELLKNIEEPIEDEELEITDHDTEMSLKRLKSVIKIRLLEERLKSLKK